MYTALEHHRMYRIGLGDEAKVLTYLYRDFPVDDAPACFNFRERESGELVTFTLPQLTALEREGLIEYLGAGL